MAATEVRQRTIWTNLRWSTGASTAVGYQRNARRLLFGLGITLSIDLEQSKHISTMTNNAPSFSFCVVTRRDAKRSLSKLLTFILFVFFMEYGATVWDPYQKYNSDKVERLQCRAARFVKSRYTRYSNVSDMLDELGWTPLPQSRQEARLILPYKINNTSALRRRPYRGI